MRNIIVVEDESDLGQLLQRILPDLLFEYRVTVKHYGALSDELLTVDAWQSQHIALVDITLPYRPGTDLLCWLHDNCSWVRKIAFTATMPIPEEAFICSDLVLRKPFNIADLRDALLGTDSEGS